MHGNFAVIIQGEKQAMTKVKAFVNQLLRGEVFRLSGTDRGRGDGLFSWA